jgi:hypothetical protein
MFYRNRRFGEVPDDELFEESVVENDLVYAQNALSSPDLSDYEKERWQAEASQFLGFSALAQPMSDTEINQWQTAQAAAVGTTESQPTLIAGFDLSSNWPVLAIIGIGLVVASRKGKKTHHRTKHKKGRR